MTIRKLLLLALCLTLATAGYSAKVAPPKPVGPLPSSAQLAWQNLEYYAFIHFGMNTFTDHEWGEGRAHPDNFNPTALDARQWARTFEGSSRQQRVARKIRRPGLGAPV